MNGAARFCCKMPIDDIGIGVVRPVFQAITVVLPRRRAAQ
jgi:hypothetical protein